MKAESMSDNLAEQIATPCSAARRDQGSFDRRLYLALAAARASTQNFAQALLAADKTGRSRAHQIARLHVLITWCEFQQSGGFKDWEAVRELFREASALWNPLQMG